jgi:hypothetical protein
MLGDKATIPTELGRLQSMRNIFKISSNMLSGTDPRARLASNPNPKPILDSTPDF